MFVAKLNNSLSSLTYATYLGGSGTVVGEAAIAVNQSREAYVIGETASTNFPTTPGPFKRPGRADGRIRHSPECQGVCTHLFHLFGRSGEEDGYGLSVDSSGYAYVAGGTISSNFPQVKSLQDKNGTTDAFVTKFLPDGSGLIYSTYLGGSGFENVKGIAVDGDGAAYVSGDTTSADFPRVNPIQGTYGGNGDGFVSKLALAGDSLTLVYSTYLGGSENEEVEAIAVDQQGAAYVTGGTGIRPFSQC